MKKLRFKNTDKGNLLIIKTSLSRNINNLLKGFNFIGKIPVLININFDLKNSTTESSFIELEGGDKITFFYYKSSKELIFSFQKLPKEPILFIPIPTYLAKKTIIKVLLEELLTTWIRKD
jgi:hypothetical protein